jgi:uncharacterized membrane protein YfcA
MTEILLLLAGVIVGVMNAIAGGGMLVGFPILLAAGVPPIVANATTGLIVLPGQLSAVFGYRKYLPQIPKRYLLIAIPMVIGATVGAQILRNTSHENFAQIIPVLILAAVVLFIFQPLLHRHVHYHIHGPKKHRDRWQPLILPALVLLPLSVYGGYFTTGFGFIMLAFLGFTQLTEIHRMNAFKNLLMIVISITVLANLATSGLVDWQHGAWMGAGSLIGGFIGAKLAQRIPSHAVRITVIVIGLTAAIYLVLRNY